MIKLLVKSKDKEYAKALAFAIAEARPGLDILLDLPGDASDCDFISFEVSDYLPLSRNLRILDELLAGKGYAISSSSSSCKSVVLTSALAVNGQSNMALLLGKVLSRFYSKRVLYLNFNKFSDYCFDRLLFNFIKEKNGGGFFSMEFCADECGLFSPEYNPGLNGLWNLTMEDLTLFINKLKSSFDYLILDVPSDYLYFDYLCADADNVIAINRSRTDVPGNTNGESKNKFYYEIDEFFFGYLKMIHSNAFSFAVDYDIDCIDTDIFSDYGSMARILAEKIEKDEL